MGSNAHYPEEAPVRTVAVDGFWIDRWQVISRRFAEFVQETGYVTVACEDADAYSAWASKALPTEAQRERAARGGLEGATFVWGDDPEAPGERLANFWHGDFPWRRDPGYGARSPVGSYAPNGYGLNDMAGNV
jgi:formylglycine-generating enzyme required for sulfatase activity